MFLLASGNRLRIPAVVTLEALEASAVEEDVKRRDLFLSFLEEKEGGG